MEPRRIGCEWLRRQRECVFPQDFFNLCSCLGSQEGAGIFGFGANQGGFCGEECLFFSIGHGVFVFVVGVAQAARHHVFACVGRGVWTVDDAGFVVGWFGLWVWILRRLVLCCRFERFYRFDQIVRCIFELILLCHTPDSFGFFHRFSHLIREELLFCFFQVFKNVSPEFVEPFSVFFICVVPSNHAEDGNCYSSTYTTPDSLSGNVSMIIFTGVAMIGCVRRVRVHYCRRSGQFWI